MSDDACDRPGIHCLLLMLTHLLLSLQLPPAGKAEELTKSLAEGTLQNPSASIDSLISSLTEQGTALKASLSHKTPTAAAAIDSALAPLTAAADSVQQQLASGSLKPAEAVQQMQSAVASAGSAMKDNVNAALEQQQDLKLAARSIAAAESLVDTFNDRAPKLKEMLRNAASADEAADLLGDIVVDMKGRLGQLTMMGLSGESMDSDSNDEEGGAAGGAAAAAVQKLLHGFAEEADKLMSSEEAGKLEPEVMLDQVRGGGGYGNVMLREMITFGFWADLMMTLIGVVLSFATH